MYSIKPAESSPRQKSAMIMLFISRGIVHYIQDEEVRSTIMVPFDNDEAPKELSAYGFRYVVTFPLPHSAFTLKINNSEWMLRMLRKDEKMDVPNPIFKKIQDASTAGVVFDYWLVGNDQLSSHSAKVGTGTFILLAGTPISGGKIHWYEVGTWSQ